MAAPASPESAAGAGNPPRPRRRRGRVKAVRSLAPGGIDMATNPNQSPNQPQDQTRKPLSGSQGAGGQEYGGGKTREGQEYALKGKGSEYTGEHKESQR